MAVEREESADLESLFGSDASNRKSLLIGRDGLRVVSEDSSDLEIEGKLRGRVSLVHSTLELRTKRKIAHHVVAPSSKEVFLNHLSLSFVKFSQLLELARKKRTRVRKRDEMGEGRLDSPPSPDARWVLLGDLDSIVGTGRLLLQLPSQLVDRHELVPVRLDFVRTPPPHRYPSARVPRRTGCTSAVEMVKSVRGEKRRGRKQKTKTSAEVLKRRAQARAMNARRNEYIPESKS